MNKNRLFKTGAWLVVVLFLTGFFAIQGFGQKSKTKSTGVRVKIIKPINGWSSDRLMELEAEIGDPDIRFAYLVENGSERMVRVRDQKVNEKMVLSPGTNQVIVQVQKNGVMYSDTIVLYSEVPKKDIKIILSWDTDGTDVDLHVVNPEGVDCYYGEKESPQGGVLDVDITDGYGPEVFTQANATTGEYKVKVHYYNDNGNPQSFAKVQVILFEGTDFEKKYYFDKVLTRTGDTFDVGTFNITDLGKQKE
jgi:uncharacterized protein YfaP (DUF2135 family)